jgi:hypothetical protein
MQRECQFRAKFTRISQPLYLQHLYKIIHFNAPMAQFIMREMWPNSACFPPQKAEKPPHPPKWFVSRDMEGNPAVARWGNPPIKGGIYV